jgi:hypothetical protein
MSYYNPHARVGVPPAQGLSVAPIRTHCSFFFLSFLRSLLDPLCLFLWSAANNNFHERLTHRSTLLQIVCHSARLPDGSLRPGRAPPPPPPVSPAAADVHGRPLPPLQPAGGSSPSAADGEPVRAAIRLRAAAAVPAVRATAAAPSAEERRPFLRARMVRLGHIV